MNSTLYKMLLSTVLFFSTFSAFSQTTTTETEATDSLQILTLEDAISFALTNNQELRIQKKLVNIAQNNVFKGNANLLPTINLIGNGSYSNSNSDLTIRTFQPQPPEIDLDESGVETSTISGVVQVDYTIFAGFSGKYQYKLLENQQQIASFQQEVIANNTLLGVSELFIEIAKLQEREKLVKQNIQVSQDRVKRLEDQVQFGKATGLLVLRAKTDLNQDFTALDDIILAQDNLKRNLNFLIGYESEKNYRVAVTYQLPVLMENSKLKTEIKANNPEVKLAQESIFVSTNQLELTKSRQLPRVGVFANYGYFRQQNDLQQLAQIQNVGFTVGASITYSIFNGNKTKTAIQNSQIELETKEMRVQQTIDRLFTDAAKAQSNLRNLSNQLEREEQNLATFEEAFKRIEEQYYNGKATSLDLRDTQTALLNARITISDIKANMLFTSLQLENLKGNSIE